MKATKFKQTEIGEIPEEREVVSLGQIVKLHYGKSLPERSRVDGNVPVYGSSGKTGFHNEPLVNEPGYIIGRKGTIGSIYYSKQPFYPIDTTYFVTKSDVKCDFKFFYYLLKTLDLDKLNSDSAVPGLNRDRAYSQKFSLPKSTEEQQQIASILSSLDDKIELNRRMNKTLEEIGKALFKRWFVDFEFPNENGEPYKSSGGEMVESELGMIPKGWKITRLGNIIEIASGKRPDDKSDIKTEYYHIPIIGASGIMGYTSKVLFYKRIICIGRVGTLGIVQKINYPCWVSDNSLVIKADNYEFVYHMLSSIDFSVYNVGSTQPLITQSSIKEILVPIPSQEVLQRFEETVAKMRLQIESNYKEILTLAEIRDLLLPRLMSGKIRVSGV
jgi:type I restriction enzyme S subunit